MATRDERYTALRRMGLTPTEAEEFSTLNYQEIPYFRDLLKARLGITRKWEGEKKSLRTHRRRVYNWYRMQGWLDQQG